MAAPYNEWIKTQMTQWKNDNPIPATLIYVMDQKIQDLEARDKLRLKQLRAIRRETEKMSNTLEAMRVGLLALLPKVNPASE